MELGMLGEKYSTFIHILTPAVVSYLKGPSCSISKCTDGLAIQSRSVAMCGTILKQKNGWVTTQNPFDTWDITAVKPHMAEDNGFGSRCDSYADGIWRYVSEFIAFAEHGLNAKMSCLSKAFWIGIDREDNLECVSDS